MKYLLDKINTLLYVKMPHSYTAAKEVKIFRKYLYYHLSFKRAGSSFLSFRIFDFPLSSIHLRKSITMSFLKSYRYKKTNVSFPPNNVEFQIH